MATRNVRREGEFTPVIGARGRKGDTGAAGPPGVMTVNHGSDANVARPETDSAVIWRGSVQPNNWDVEKDFWFEVIS